MGATRRRKKISVEKVAEAVLLAMLSLSLCYEPSQSYVFFYWLAATIVTFVGARRTCATNVRHSVSKLLASLPSLVSAMLYITGLVVFAIVVLALSFPPVEMDFIIRAYTAGMGALAVFFAFYPTLERLCGVSTAGLCIALSGVILISMSLVGTVGHTEDFIGISVAITAINLLSTDSFPAMIGTQCIAYLYAWFHRNVEIERENPFSIQDIVLPALVIAHASRFTKKRRDVQGKYIGKIEENLLFTYATSTGLLIVLQEMNILRMCPIFEVTSPLCVSCYLLSALLNGKLKDLKAFPSTNTIGTKEI